jgi:hypothetical protein
MAYAHAVIETPDRTYKRGDEVPADLDGYDQLVEAGSVRDEAYDPAEEPVQTPEFVEINGVRYVKTGESSGSQEDSNAG